VASCVLFAAILLLVVTFDVDAQDEFTPIFNPSLHVSRAAGDIKIDGRLEDAGWVGAAVATGFVEHSPGDQIEPPVDTRAMITYDDENLYVAIIAYDDPAKVRASWCERDRMYSDDNVGFFLDTYGDASWAYTMNVNPYGIQADALWTNGYGEDSKYDLIWESSGQITDSGYQVELAIPFASLRFPQVEEQVWRVEIYRHHYRESHYEIGWAPYNRDESCWPCQWGTVTGISDVEPGKGIEIIPAFVGFQSGQLNDVVRDGLTDSLDFVNDDVDGDLSMSGKYAIGSNATVELTVNPDFSQVEADADQIDVNSTTALSFPEKRPFFQEGSDLFQSPFGVVYTRSINDPDFAAKATARFGRTSFAYLSAHDENSPLIVPFEEFSSPVILGGKSTSNLLKLKQTFGNGSQAGLLITDRRFEGSGSGTVISLDGSLKLSKSWQLVWQGAASHIAEIDDKSLTSASWMDRFDDIDSTSLNDQLFDDEHTAGFDGESFWGHGYYGELAYDGKNTYNYFSYTESSPTFRLDNGFLARNDRRVADLYGSYMFRYDESLIQTIQPDINFARVWNADGIIKDEWINTNLAVRFRWAQSYMHASYMVSSELYGGIQFDGIWSAHNCFSMTPSRYVALGGGITHGRRIARSNKVFGYETQASAWIDLHPIDRILLENTYNYIQSRAEITDEMLYKGFIARSRLNVQFSREFSLRFVTQYNDFGETWEVDPLITYRLNPFTLFYIGTTYDYLRIHDLDENRSAYADVDNGATGYDDTRLASRQFFMKLQYLFQL
jgi:hypothetical protein